MYIQAGTDDWQICSEWGSMSGGAHYMFDMYSMWCFVELTQLYASDFLFMCQVLPNPMGKAQGDRVTHSMISALYIFDNCTLITNYPDYF